MADTSKWLIALEDLLQRLRNSEPGACDHLVVHVYQRFRAIVHRKLGNYPGVQQFEETTDVLHKVLIDRIRAALPRTRFEGADHFIRWSTTIITHYVIDLLHHYWGPEGLGAKQGGGAPRQDSDSQFHPANEAEDSTYDPAKLAEYTEWFEKLEGLPAEEREVMYLRFYEEMSAPEAAVVLGIHPTTFRRRLKHALDHLPPSPWGT